MKPTWAAASIVVVSARRSPAQISAALGLTPTRSHSKGSLLSPRNPTSKRRTKNVWVLDSGLDSDEPMAQHLKTIRVLIDPHREALRRLSSEASIELFLGWSKDPRFSGFTVDADTVRLMSDIGGSVVLDLYCE